MTFISPTPSGSYSSSSPLRSSPLSSQPPVYAPSRTPSPGGVRRPNPLPIPDTTPLRRSSLSHSSSSRPIRSSLSPMTPNPSTSPPPSISPGQATPSPPLSRSQPLLGSYPLSLLHSRMSHAHAPHSVQSSSTSGFSLHLGALGMGRACPPELRCPSHLVIPFSATYYDLEDPSAPVIRRKGALQSPWVGNINLEAHYFQQYAPDGDIDFSTTKQSVPSTLTSPPAFPGYRVAPVGQLQILVKTPTQAVKVFLVPYDLRMLPIGGRLLARERTYVQSAEEISTSSSPSTVNRTPPQRKEALRYAFQLQFVCVQSSRLAASANSSRNSSTTRRKKIRPAIQVSTGTSISSQNEMCTQGSSASTSSSDLSNSIRSTSAASNLSGRDFYVSRNLKVIFTSSPPEKHEIVRGERTDEIVLPSASCGNEHGIHGGGSGGGKIIGFSPGSITSREDDWETVRMKWNAREDFRSEVQAVDIDDGKVDDAVPTVGRDISQRGRPGSYERELQTLFTPAASSSYDIPGRVDVSAISSLGFTSPSGQKLIPSKGPYPLERLPAILSRPTTPSPTPQTFDLPSPTRTVSPQPVMPVVWTPASQRGARHRGRRGSASAEERELSERLRAIELGAGGERDEPVA